MMDRTDPADWSSIQMLVVAYSKHVLPLAWQVLDGGHQIGHTLNLIRNDPVSLGLERLRILLCRPQHIEIIQRMIAPVPDRPGILQECALIHLPSVGQHYGALLGDRRLEQWHNPTVEVVPP